ncbi:alpha-beta hydrolase superfamily lysophospholipase [Friedmanniella endophytica]|uniref:Alpha-beta hydrolase superfamily lysophospholipase n=1 Tax=Microlunatus kandeliicorticis TaxID=1759536 RepID=A0A7W3INS3_9ACTN|nr:alpha/beta hydrolase [Microlunatus kandeliicorticis]MBA8792455.1 alpha-beta hydrolase superfamily lysophospholipase [Microlunatus kandeliicorticis]
MSDWSDDLLPGYASRTLALPGAERAAGEPEDTELCATLVHRRPEPGRAAGRRAVLYLHGWNDYFFQTHLADFCAELGYDFFALDLRRYGRSLRPGQLPGFITDLEEYDAELDAAHALIAHGDPDEPAVGAHDEVLLMGHSTGGLIASLWAARRPGAVVGLVLNSPWLDLQGSAMVRAVGTPVIDAVGGRNPTAVIRLPDAGLYARTLHINRGGEWEYDTSLKAHPGPPIRVGWLRAVRHGHQKVAAGLGITVPVLVLASTRTKFTRQWDEELRGVDSVLDVEQIVSRAGRLGPHVTIVRFERGIHDLVLSRPEVRRRVFSEIARWCAAYLPVRTAPGAG